MLIKPQGFLNVAFQAARNTDGQARLYINDYNLDSVNSKVAGLVNLVNTVNSGTNRLIDGCGTQAHLAVRHFNHLHDFPN